jgi:hypothetical protein
LFQNMPHSIQINHPRTRNSLPLVQHGELSASHSRCPIPFRLKTMCLIDCPNSKVQRARSEAENSVALVRQRTIRTERSPLVDEVSCNFYGYGVLCGQENVFSVS